jgi:hypothetical protein
MSPCTLMRRCHLLSAIGLLAVLSTSARAEGVLPLTVPGNVGTLEGSGPFQMTFTVFNNTGSTLLLDYALAVITPLGPDPDDIASFAGAGGSNGLASANLYMLAGKTASFTYNVFTPNPPDGNDFGVNRFDFYSEFQTYTGPVSSLPPQNNISSANNFVAFVAQNSTQFNEDPNAFAMLSAFAPLAYGQTLFTNVTPGANPTEGIYVASSISMLGDPNPFDKSPRIFVYDQGFGVPEPASIVMLGTAVLVLLGCSRIRRVSRAHH